MKINCIATGSSGNLYELVDSDGNSMLIEAGVSRQMYVKHRVGVTPPEMCIISHSHMDHDQYIGEFQAIMEVHLAQETNTSEHWKAFGFKMKHGDGFSMAYIIKSLTENKFLFFGTDMEYSNDYDALFWALNEYKVENYLIECNYSDYLLHLATPEQRIGCSRHFSDNDVVNFIRKSGSKNPKIITIHGSNRLSIDSYIKKYIDGKLIKYGIDCKIDCAIGAKIHQKNIFII